MLNTAILGKFARMELARKKLKAKYDDLTKKLMAMEPALLEHLQDQDEPVEKISLKNGIILNVQTTIWAKVKTNDKELLGEALDKAGLSHIRTTGVNHSSLSAYLRELDLKNEALPESLQGLVEPNPVDKIRVRRVR